MNRTIGMLKRVGVLNRTNLNFFTKRKFSNTNDHQQRRIEELEKTIEKQYNAMRITTAGNLVTIGLGITIIYNLSKINQNLNQ